MMLKLRNCKNLPVFHEPSAKILGRVDKAVVGDSYQIEYVIINLPDSEQRLIRAEDFQLTNEAIIIQHEQSMKSYAHGEELSVNERKIGDVVFDNEGEQLGIASDFIIDNDKKVWGLEISSGILADLLEGRQEVPLAQLKWKSPTSGVIDLEGRDYC